MWPKGRSAACAARPRSFDVASWIGSPQGRGAASLTGRERRWLAAFGLRLGHRCRGPGRGDGCCRSAARGALRRGWWGLLHHVRGWHAAPHAGRGAEERARDDGVDATGVARLGARVAGSRGREGKEGHRGLQRGGSPPERATPLELTHSGVAEVARIEPRADGATREASRRSPSQDGELVGLAARMQRQAAWWTPVRREVGSRQP
jgi:hypothetical protein